MGLRDRLKGKKSKENDPDEVGGLADKDLETNWGSRFDSEEAIGLHQDKLEVSSAQQGFQGPVALAEDGKRGEGEKGKGDDSLSGLDIFASEMAIEEDPNKLADQLPSVDIQDLLRECRELASRLREGIGGDR